MDIFEFAFTVFILVPVGVILWGIALGKRQWMMELFTKKKEKCG